MLETYGMEIYRVRRVRDVDDRVGGVDDPGECFRTRGRKPGEALKAFAIVRRLKASVPVKMHRLAHDGWELEAAYALTEPSPDLTKEPPAGLLTPEEVAKLPA